MRVKSIIKSITLVLVIAMSIMLGACGGKSSIGNILGDNTAQPSSGTPNQSQGGNETISLGAVEGVPQSGYGYFTYHNFRYEGNWENSMPNGEGILYIAKSEHDPSKLWIVNGNWVDGLPNGEIVLQMIDRDPTHPYPTISYCFVVENGTVNSEMKVSAIEDASFEMFLPLGWSIGVPPWASFMNTDPLVEAPGAGGSIEHLVCTKIFANFATANEGSRIAFRITTPDMEDILASSGDYLWVVRFELGGEQWYAHANIETNGRISSRAHAVNTGDGNWQGHVYSRVYFEQNDAIIDFLVYDGYSFDWNTLNITQIVYPVKSGANLEINFNREMIKPMEQVKQREIQCITTISYDPDDITITATRNANNTLSYTYNNKGITSKIFDLPIEWFNSPAIYKPLSARYMFHIYARREITPEILAYFERLNGRKLYPDEILAISAVVPTQMESEWYNYSVDDVNSQYLVNIYDNIGGAFWWDILSEYLSVSNLTKKVDENGLTITWNMSPAPGMGSLDDIIGFYVSTGINIVSNEYDANGVFLQEKIHMSEGYHYELGLEIMK